MTDGQEINRLKLEMEALKKEVALVREDAQVDILTQAQKYADNIFEKDNRIKELEIISKEHQKLNGKLQVKLSKYEDKAAHYRRKAIL